MYYSFQKNVYLVKGEKRGCIYDLNNSKLYSINHELTEKLDLVNQGNLCTDITDKSLIQMLEKLENLNIIRILVKPESHYLGEIKAADNGCSFAWIEITNKCNLRCIHCYNESDANRNAIMSLDNYKLAIDSLLKLGVRKIQIIGGEPFVYKQLLRSMLDYAIGKFAQIEVFTNGTLVTDEWFEYLKKK